MAFHRLKQEELAWINENKKIEAENLKLYHKIERLKHDPEYIENVARQELGMTGKDEIIIKFKNKKMENNDERIRENRQWRNEIK